MRLPPRRAVAIDESAPGQELEGVVPALEHLALKRLAAPDYVAHPLLRLGRDPDRRELARPVEPRQLHGVVRVMLALPAGPGGDQRRRDHVAVVPPAGERAVHDRARAAGLVAGPNPVTARDQPLAAPPEFG